MKQRTKHLTMRVALIDRPSNKAPIIFLDFFENDTQAFLCQVKIYFKSEFSNQKQCLFVELDESTLSSKLGLIPEVILKSFFWAVFDSYGIFEYPPTPYVHAPMGFEGVETDFDRTVRNTASSLRCKYDGQIIWKFEFRDYNMDYANEILGLQ